MINTETENAPSSGGLLQFFMNLTNKELTTSNIEPALAHAQTHLISKNVAKPIAENICASVGQSLVGKTIGSLSSKSKIEYDTQCSLTI